MSNAGVVSSSLTWGMSFFLFFHVKFFSHLIPWLEINFNSNFSAEFLSIFCQNQLQKATICLSNVSNEAILSFTSVCPQTGTVNFNYHRLAKQIIAILGLSFSDWCVNSASWLRMRVAVKINTSTLVQRGGGLKVYCNLRYTSPCPHLWILFVCFHSSRRLRVDTRSWIPKCIHTHARAPTQESSCSHSIAISIEIRWTLCGAENLNSSECTGGEREKKILRHSIRSCGFVDQL